MSELTYPLWVEKWWLSQAARIFNGSLDEKSHLLLEKLRQLTGILAVDREAGFDGYSFDEKSLAAYGLFQFPQNFARTACVLDEILRYRCPEWGRSPRLKVLDLGSGAGASTLAVLDFLTAHYEPKTLDVTAVDQSALALSCLTGLLEARPRTQIAVNPTCVRQDVRNFVAGRPGPALDLVVVSFCLNEMFSSGMEPEAAAFLLRLMDATPDGGLVLVVEPAMKSTCGFLQGVRELVRRNQGIEILGPCLQNEACPLFPPKEHWCHEVRSWEAPESTRYLNRKLFRTLDVVKFSFLAIGHAGVWARVPEDSFRAVTPPVREKGKGHVTGCTTYGTLERVEALSRTGDAAKSLARVQRGDLCRVKGERIELKEKQRFRLPAEAQVEILFSPGI